MTVKFLKSFNGDCIAISFEDEAGKARNILIDGGIAETYRLDKDEKGKISYGELKHLIDKLRAAGQYIDLLILTHIDDDHIAGILKWFDNDPLAHELVKEVWFNSGPLIAETLDQDRNPELEHVIDPYKTRNTSVSEGVQFSAYIKEKNIWYQHLIRQGNTLERFGLTFQVLSPDVPKLKKLLDNWKKKDPDLKTAAKPGDYDKTLKEHLAADRYRQDTAYPNGSSIAFILTYGTKKFLFLGDSHPSVIIKGLKTFGYTSKNPLDAALVKLAHHGSKGNTSLKMLQCINARDFVISSNGRTHQHPHKQLLARLINHQQDCRLFFNYEERMLRIFSEKDLEDFPGFEMSALKGGLSF